jgi:hypothetical protein
MLPMRRLVMELHPGFKLRHRRHHRRHHRRLLTLHHRRLPTLRHRPLPTLHHRRHRTRPRARRRRQFPSRSQSPVRLPIDGVHGRCQRHHRDQYICEPILFWLNHINHGPPRGRRWCVRLLLQRVSTAVQLNRHTSRILSARSDTGLTG